MKYKVVCLLLFLPFLYSTACAQHHLLSPNIAAPFFLDTVTFEFAKHKIIIPVFLNGKQRRFIIDTGAPTLITKELQEESKFQVIDKQLIADINQRLDSAYQLQIPQLNIGKIAFNEVKATLANLNAGLLACFQIDGIIGSDILKNIILHIDYQQKIIVLTNEISKLDLAPKHSVPLLLEANQSTPIIEIKPFPQAKEQVFIDTGDDDFYSMGLRSFHFFMQKTNLIQYLTSHTKGASTYGFYGTEADTTKYVMRFDSLKISHIYFSDVVTSTYTNPNSRLGAALLKYGTTTIDYLNKKFYFVPFENIQPIVLKHSRDSDLGISLKNDGDLLKIGAVWEGSEAWKKGIKANEIVEKINEYELLGKNICELMFTLEKAFEQVAAFTLTLSDAQGKRRVVTLNID